MLQAWRVVGAGAVSGVSGTTPIAAGRPRRRTRPEPERRMHSGQRRSAGRVVDERRRFAQRFHLFLVLLRNVRHVEETLVAGTVGVDGRRPLLLVERTIVLGQLAASINNKKKEIDPSTVTHAPHLNNMAAQLYNTKKKGINQPEAVAMTTAFDQLSIGVKKKVFN